MSGRTFVCVASVSEGFDYAHEVVALEAGAAYEAAVDVGFGKELSGVGGFAAAAIEYGGVVGYFLAVLGGYGFAYEGVYFFGLVGCGGFAGAYGPYGFVGDDDFREVFGREVEEAFPELFLDDVEVFAGFAFFKDFAYAEYGGELVFEGEGGFFAEGLGCFAVVLAAFAVSQDDVCGAGRGYHGG